MKTIVIALFLFMSMFSVASASDHKVWVCHVPPGNPANTHAIHISENAVSTHVGNHGGDFVMENENTPCLPPASPEPTAISTNEPVVTPEPTEVVVTPAPTDPAPVVTPIPTEVTPDATTPPVVTPDVDETPEVVTTPDVPSVPNAPEAPVTTQAETQPAQVTALPSTGSGAESESSSMTMSISLGVASLMFAGTAIAALRKE